MGRCREGSGSVPVCGGSLTLKTTPGMDVSGKVAELWVRLSKSEVGGSVVN